MNLYRLLLQQAYTDLGLHHRGELAAVIEGNKLVSSMPGPYHPSKEEASKSSHKYSCAEVTQLLWKVITISTACVCVWAHVHEKPGCQDHPQKIYKNHTLVGHDVVVFGHNVKFSIFYWITNFDWMFPVFGSPCNDESTGNMWFSALKLTWYWRVPSLCPILFRPPQELAIFLPSLPCHSPTLALSCIIPLATKFKLWLVNTCTCFIKNWYFYLMLTCVTVDEL